MGFFAVCLLIIVNFQVAKKIGSVYEKMMQFKDARISLTQDVLMGIRQIKYLNWEPVFERKIIGFRAKEFACLKVAKYLDALCVFFWATTTIVISTFSFVAYDILGDDIRKINVFTAISLFNMLIFPLNALPWTIGGMLTGRVSFRRLMGFFSIPEIPRDKNEKDYENAISVKNMGFVWPLQKSNDSDEKIDKLINNDGVFSLKKLNFEIKNGSLTLILGKIGSGKTALANAILKEMEESDDGLLISDIFSKKECNGLRVNGRIGYVSQNTWLQNTSIKVNFIFD